MEIRLEDFTSSVIRKVEDYMPETVDFWLREYEGFKSSGNIHIDASFSKSNAQILMQAKMTGHIIGVCSRCLEDANIDVDTDLTIMFLPASTERKYKEDEEVELTSDELDIEYYKGNKINADYLFREGLLLAIPFSPLCNDECKGLCPNCGCNLNRGECHCGEKKQIFNSIKINLF